MKIGDRVFIHDYQAFGTIKEIWPDGTISKVEIITPYGVRIVDAVRLVITVVKGIRALILLIRRIKKNRKERREQ